MAGNGANIGIGPGWLYAAPIATADPANNETSLPVDWISLGYTEDGNQFSYAVTSEDIEVAESVDPVATQETKALSKVTFSMAEMTRRNLGLALGRGLVANDDSILEPAALGSRLYFKLIWQSLDHVTPAVSDTANIRWLFRKCFVSGSLDISHKKAPAKALLPVEISCYRPDSATAPWAVFPNAAFKVA